MNEVERLLFELGFRPSGDYRPAEVMDDGRYNVDPTTLLLLLSVYKGSQRT